MNAVIGDFLGQIKLGKAQVHEHMTVFPLLRAHDAQAQYLTLDEALATERLRITERGEAGSVPALFLHNTSEQWVLIFDGEELVGAKQNRIVNTTILVRAGSAIEIPVSCVEQGRWSYASQHFGSERRMMYAGLRAAKADQVLCSVRGGGTFEADQSAIWKAIDERSVRSTVTSRTGAMADIYVHEKKALDRYEQAFSVQDDQLGAIFAIDGKIVGLECFGRRDTLRALFPKLVQSYALDATDSTPDSAPKQATPAAARRLLAAAAKAGVETRPSVGEGTDLRLETPKVTGLGLALGDELLHLSVFAKKKPAGAGAQAMF